MSSRPLAGPSETARTTPPALTVPFTLGLAIHHVEVHVTDDAGNLPPRSACPELLLAEMQDLKVHPSDPHKIRTSCKSCNGLFTSSGRQAGYVLLAATQGGFLMMSFKL